jgi:hypothetical protein
MKEFCLTWEEFEELFGLEEEEYKQFAPSWLQYVPPTRVDRSIATILQEYRDARNAADRLEKALRTAGVPIPEDIPYEEAKQKISEITLLLNANAMSERNHSKQTKLSQELERYTVSLMASDEYQRELQRQEEEWEESQSVENQNALRLLRRHMPVNIRFLSEATLHEGHGLPKALARKFKRTDILQLIRMAPGEIARLHPSTLDNLKTSGLTLTERRALHEHLKTLRPKWERHKDAASSRKLRWYQMLERKLRESIGAWDRHVDLYGGTVLLSSSSRLNEQHKCNMLGNLCPFKANAAVDYSGDYAFPVGDEYEAVDVTVATQLPSMLFKQATDFARPSFLSSIVSRPTSESSALIKNGLPSISPTDGYKRAAAADKMASPSNQNFFEQKDNVQTVRAESMPHFASGEALQRNLKQKLHTQSRGDLSTVGSEYSSPVIKKRHESTSDLEGPASTPKQTDDGRARTSFICLQDFYAGKDIQLFAAEESYKEVNLAIDRIETQLDIWITAFVTGEEIDDDGKDGLVLAFDSGLAQLHPIIEELAKGVNCVTRSVIECEITEDFVAMLKVFFSFIMGRMKELRIKNKPTRMKIRELNESVSRIHERNMKNLRKLGVRKPQRVRVIRSISQIAQEKMGLKRQQKIKKKRREGGTVDSQRYDIVDCEGISKTIDASNAIKDSALLNTSVAPGRSDNFSELGTVGESMDYKVVEAPVSKKVTGSHISKQSNGLPSALNTFRSSVVRAEDFRDRENLKWQLVRQSEEALQRKLKLEKAMNNAGITDPDQTIPYDVAEAKIVEISRHMTELGCYHPEHFQLEQELEKYSAALASSDEYKHALDRKEMEWEQSVVELNRDALIRIRRHMAVNVRNMSESELCTLPTPSGKLLPKSIARKFKRTSVLQLLRLDPRDIEKMHFATLEALSLSGLTITERRALHEHIRSIGTKWETKRSFKATERKVLWYNQMKSKFKNELQIWEKHVDNHEPSGNHVCLFSGTQCPVQTDESFDYSQDYGFSEGDDYERLVVTKEDVENLSEKAIKEAHMAVQLRKQFWTDVSCKQN